MYASDASPRKVEELQLGWHPAGFLFLFYDFANSEACRQRCATLFVTPWPERSLWVQFERKLGRIYGEKTREREGESGSELTAWRGCCCCCFCAVFHFRLHGQHLDFTDSPHRAHAHG